MSMSSEFKNNHYVPEWYQKRFALPGNRSNEHYYLDLNPRRFVDSKGSTHYENAIRKLGFGHCFAEEDLYTTNFNGIESRDIEKIFFGEIDRNGRSAVDYFSTFQHPSIDHEAYRWMMLYMSTQKLRTPKGLAWLADQVKASNKMTVLRAMLKLQQLHCAIWAECIWSIADASQSATKFIISDHPVTVYNRICGPRSQRCRGFNDPEIWLNGTHTIFPLSYEKVLILTNLSWVRNPYQSETKSRPNPNPFRSAIFKYSDIQTMRQLSEQEVIEINYVIKRRSYRYLAAAKKEWLYPEEQVSSKKWNEYGYGYLFMPDPRPVNLGGEIVIGHNDGTASWYDEYGRRPGQRDYGKEGKEHSEGETLYRFKGEFARLFGPKRRGRTFEFMKLDDEFDDEKFHKYHLDLEKRRHRTK
jgi:hypothetical protein